MQKGIKRKETDGRQESSPHWLSRIWYDMNMKPLNCLMNGSLSVHDWETITRENDTDDSFFSFCKWCNTSLKLLPEHLNMGIRQMDDTLMMKHQLHADYLPEVSLAAADEPCCMTGKCRISTDNWNSLCVCKFTKCSVITCIFLFHMLHPC